MKPKRHSQRRYEFYYGWVIVAVVALANFSQTAETFPVWGVLLKPMTEDFGWSRSAFAGAMTIGTLLGAATAMGFGPSIDRFGPRWSLVIGFTIVGGTLVLMAGISTLWQFYVLLVLGRVVHLGVIGIGTMVIIPKWFVVKRGRAVAIGGVGNRIGSAVTPLYVQALTSITSWRNAVVMVGIMVWVVSLLPAAIFLRRQPEDIGLLPDGTTLEEIEDRRRQSCQHSSGSTTGLDISFTLGQVVRMPAFYLVTTTVSLSLLVGTTTSLHIVAYLTDRGLDPQVAVLAIALSAAVGAAGSLLFGLLAERRGVRWTATFDLFLVAVAFGLVQFVRSPLGVMLWSVYYGLTSGGMFTLLQILFADYFGRGSLGTIRGVVSPVQSGVQAIGPVGAALAYDITGSYVWVFGLFAILTLCAALCVLIARPPVSSGFRPIDSPPLSTP